MLLALNVGNTNTSIGLYDGSVLMADWRIRTETRRTSDEYGILLLGLLNSHRFPINKVDGAIISNVVLPTQSPLLDACVGYLGVEPYAVDPETFDCMKILYKPRSSVGADRIVNAFAAYTMYGGPAITVDMGTATNFDVVSSDGDYLGGAIAPGIGICIDALSDAAPRLPRVDLVPPGKAIADTTTGSLQTGILYGFVDQIDGIVTRFQRELGAKAKVIATGGLAEIIAPESKTIEMTNPLLTLEGLRLIWEQQRSSSQQSAVSSQ